MQTRLAARPLSVAVFVTITAAFVALLAWSVLNISQEGTPSTRSAALGWGLLAVTASTLLILVVARPIVIPWFLIRARRAWQTVFPPMVRYDAPTTSSTAADDGQKLEQFLREADAAAQRAQEVQDILDAARPVAPAPAREPLLRTP